MDNRNVYAAEETEINLYDFYIILKKRVKLIILIVILAALISGIISFLMQPVYKTVFVVTLPVISAGGTQKILDELSVAIEEKRYTTLAEKLGLDKKIVEKFKYLGATIPFSRPGEHSYVEIEFHVTDTSVIRSVKDGIVSFLNSNKYVKERIKSQKHRLSGIQHDIESRIKEIEQFRNILTTQILEGNKSEISFNPMSMERDVMEFKKELRKVEDETQLLRGFEIVVEPYNPVKPIKPRKRIIVAATSLISFIFVIIFVLVKDGLVQSRKSIYVKE
jgi:LPS O-antigen subunit length determinant protein (WzzB/FepE family)